MIRDIKEIHNLVNGGRTIPGTKIKKLKGRSVSKGRKSANLAVSRTTARVAR